MGKIIIVWNLSKISCIVFWKDYIKLLIKVWWFKFNVVVLYVMSVVFVCDSLLREVLVYLM